MAGGLKVTVWSPAPQNSSTWSSDPEERISDTWQRREEGWARLTVTTELRSACTSLLTLKQFGRNWKCFEGVHKFDTWQEICPGVNSLLKYIKEKRQYKEKYRSK